MRSRTVSRPWSRCRLTLSTPPISRANASRRARSSSSGFQFIRLLRIDAFFVVTGGFPEWLSRAPVGEDVAVGPPEQAAARHAQLEHLRRDLLVQPLLIIHRGKQSA